MITCQGTVAVVWAGSNKRITDSLQVSIHRPVASAMCDLQQALHAVMQQALSNSSSDLTFRTVRVWLQRQGQKAPVALTTIRLPTERSLVDDDELSQAWTDFENQLLSASSSSSLPAFSPVLIVSRYNPVKYAMHLLQSCSLQVLKGKYNTLISFYSDVKESRVVAEAVLKRSGSMYFAICSDLQRDAGLALIALAHRTDSADPFFISWTFFQNRDFALGVATTSFVSFEVESLAMTKVFQCHRNDCDIVKAYLEHSNSSLWCASTFHTISKEVWRTRRDLLMTAVSRRGDSLTWFDQRLCNDKAVVLAAVSNYGLALKHAYSVWQNDRTVVLAAVTNNPQVFGVLHDKLKRDWKVVARAALTLKRRNQSV